jgi:hypothetical protein
VSRTRGPSSQSTGQASPAIQMSASSQQTDWLPMESPSMSSAEDSPARTSAWPERVLVLQERGRDSGANTTDSLANFDRGTSSWRTSQHCLVEGLTRFSETWPRSGMTRSGTAYRLPTWAPLTDEIGSGLLPTPVTVDGGSYFNRSASEGATLRPTLGAMARHNLWPTPTLHGNYNRKGASANSGDGLATAVKLWATPNVVDSKGGTRRGKGQVQLCHQVKFDTPRTSPRTAREYDGVSPLGNGGLNPTWVEWLMGFPSGWTALSASETPSSRKSRKSSGGQS